MLIKWSSILLNSISSNSVLMDIVIIIPLLFVIVIIIPLLFVNVNMWLLCCSIRESECVCVREGVMKGQLGRNSNFLVKIQDNFFPLNLEQLVASINVNGVHILSLLNMVICYWFIPSLLHIFPVKFWFLYVCVNCFTERNLWKKGIGGSAPPS